MAPTPHELLELTTLPKLFQEVLELCAFMAPQELSNLMCTTPWKPVESSRRDVWHTYFVLRYGSEIGASRQTQLRVIHSWVDIDSLPWPLAAGFCGAETALDHTFWFLPLTRNVRARLAPRHRALPPDLRWHVAAVAQAQTEASRASSSTSGSAPATGRLLRCFICDLLEVVPKGPAPHHFRQRWARPCSCTALQFAHRACLERRLSQAARCDRSSPDAQKVPAGLHCPVCGDGYTIATRFPENMSELCWQTLLEWRWLLKRVICVMVCFAWILTLARHYCAPRDDACFSTSMELGTILLFTATMMSITMTQRFHFSVQLIWNTPSRRLYFRLLALFAIMFYLLAPRAIDPSHWEAIAAKRPVLAQLHAVHEMIHTTYIGSFLFSGVSLLYLATASGIIFLFWKTSMRVPTVADAGSTEEKGSCGSRWADAHNGEVGCGLCQLGLCLNNTFM